MRRWILTVDHEAAYDRADTIKAKFRKAARIPEDDLVVVTLNMSVTLIETDRE